MAALRSPATTASPSMTFTTGIPPLDLRALRSGWDIMFVLEYKVPTLPFLINPLHISR